MAPASSKKYAPNYTKSKRTGQIKAKPAPEPEIINPNVGARKQTNAMAIVSLVLAVIAFFGTGGLLSPVSLILGFVAKSQIKKTGEEGDNLATIAIVLSLIQLVLAGVLLICFGSFIGLSCCLVPFSGN